MKFLGILAPNVKSGKGLGVGRPAQGVQGAVLPGAATSGKVSKAGDHPNGMTVCL